MLYSLSTKVIAETVRAIVAMELLSAKESDRLLLAPLIDPGRRSLLMLLVRNSFAETVVSILPFVEDADLDGEKADAATAADDCNDAAADPLLKISLRVPPVSSGGIHGTIRRHLEMAVTLRVILSSMLASPEGSGSALAAGVSDSLNRHLSSLTAILRQPVAPFIRSPFGC